jgi:type VI secretion system protein ImpI
MLRSCFRPAAMSIEVQIKQPGVATNRALRFSQSPVRIGRNQLNDIPLEDPFVSEWHGIIRFDDRQISYFDLGSTNGTLLDGKRLAKNLPAKLSEASRLQLGMLEIAVVLLTEPKTKEPDKKREDTVPTKTLGWGAVASASRARGAKSAPGGGSPVHPLADAAKTPGGSSPAWPGPTSGEAVASPLPPSPGQKSPVADDGAPGAAAPDLVARQAVFIEAFSEAFVGLRKGYEQFGAEVGVRTVSGSTPLHRARTARELLDHLMLPSVDAATTARDLIGIFADFGIHHIALMEGITEGVRSVLQSLNPRANELDGAGRLWTASKIKNQWRSYLERFDLLVTDDEELHAAIFSDAFARAYASVTLGDGRGNRTGENS